MQWPAGYSLPSLPTADTLAAQVLTSAAPTAYILCHNRRLSRPVDAESAGLQVRGARLSGRGCWERKRTRARLGEAADPDWEGATPRAPDLTQDGLRRAVGHHYRGRLPPPHPMLENGQRQRRRSRTGCSATTSYATASATTTTATYHFYNDNDDYDDHDDYDGCY